MLFAVLSPAFSFSRIPTIRVRIKISPREETVKEMFETRLRDIDSNDACVSTLGASMRLAFYGRMTLYLFCPSATS